MSTSAAGVAPTAEAPAGADHGDRLLETLVRSRVAAYRRPGTEVEELEQIAAVALWLASRRYDPARGVKFETFARRTIDGEIKRWFRDHTWPMGAPRRLKNLAVRIAWARADLAGIQGEPSVDQLASYLGQDADEVREAEGVRAARVTTPLPPQHDREGSGDDFLETIVLVGAIRRLPPRLQEVVVWRYWGDLKQSEIAELVGCSQVHVSRLLREAHRRLRQILT